MILNIGNISDTYQTKIPVQQLEKLKSRKWLQIKKGSRTAKVSSYLVGKLMGDGHLDNNFVACFIGNKTVIMNLKKLIFYVHHVEKKHFFIKEKKALGSSFVLRVNDCLFGRMLFCLGAPKGNKTKQEFLVPDWIYNSKAHAKFFLKGLLEDELTTIKIEKNNYSVTPKLKLAKEESLIYNLKTFLTQIRCLLNKFDVTCSEVSYCETNQKAKQMYISIRRNKQNVLNFAKRIGFWLNNKKVKVLNNCAKVLEKTKYNRKPFIDKAKIIELGQKGLSIRQISSIVNLNKSSVHRVLLKDKNGAGEGI